MSNKQREKLLGRSFREIFSAAPGMFVGIYFLLGVQGILTSIPILCMQVFFDEVTVFAAGECSYARLLGALAAVLLVKGLLQVISGMGDYFYEYHELLCACKLGFRTNEKAYVQPGIFFEKKEELDNLEKVYQGAGSVRKLVDMALMLLLNYLPSFLVLGWYLYRAKPLLVLIMLLLFLPAFFSYKAKKQNYRKLVDQTAPIQRKIEAYCGYMGGREAYKETRLLGIFSWLHERTAQLLKERSKLGWTAMWKSDLREAGVKLVSVTGYVLILLLLYQSVRRGEITVGCFTAIFAYLDKLFEMMEGMVYEVFGRTAELLGGIEYYFRFKVRKEEEYADVACPDLKEIALENVSFRYPNAKEDALKGVSAKITAGEHIAVVGENGSGKSTLVKLLMGFYEPTTGNCYYNGKTIRSYRRGEITRKMSAVVQNFEKYQMTLKENVQIADFASDVPVESAIYAAGITVLEESFPQGEDTMLSREFGGIDISGGQWQRVALARGWYRPCEMIFLDEPTSAIDPVEEMQMYQRFQMLAEGKTMLLVTHRMGAVQLADRIFVMQQGRLVGDGSHDDLMKHCKEYQRLWNAQAAQYQ